MGMQCCFWGLRWHNKLMQQRDENGKKERRENRDRTKARQLYFCVCECELNKPTSNIDQSSQSQTDMVKLLSLLYAINTKHTY